MPVGMMRGFGMVSCISTLIDESRWHVPIPILTVYQLHTKGIPDLQMFGL